MASTRRLAAILAADVAGYSRLMGADEEGTHERLKAQLQELVDPKIKEHRGRTVKNTGDGFLAEFASVVDAVRCAVEVQRGMIDRESEVPDYQRIRFRMGINLGDVIAEEHDIFGDGVNVAARLEALAEPGGICVSRVVRDQVRDRLDYAFEDLGEQQVKNIARPVHVYRIPLAEAARTNTPLPLPDMPSLAVLPFQNMTGDVEQDYFVDGIVEEITTAISRLPWLFVIARNSSFTYKGKAVDVKQVARELGVRYVLEGSVRKAGNRVRITGQLIDTATGAHIWADRFDGALDDIFELQDQVASNVVGVIEPKLQFSEIERAKRKPTQSLNAYDMYLRALAKFHTYTRESLRQAILLLKQALAVDASYAPAAAMIGWCRINQSAQSLEPASDLETEESINLAREAIEAGKDDPDTLWMAAFTLGLFAGAQDSAAGAIERALRLNPNSAHAWMASAWMSCYRNEPDLAIEPLQRAMRLSPLDPLGYMFSAGFALAHMVGGRYATAIEWADRCLQEQPRLRVALRIRVASCAHLGRKSEARRSLRQLLEVQLELTLSLTRLQLPSVAPEVAALYVEGLRKAGLPEE
jgi:adenylate cyclase